jgi:hypothetical protein
MHPPCGCGYLEHMLPFFGGCGLRKNFRDFFIAFLNSPFLRNTHKRDQKNRTKQPREEGERKKNGGKKEKRPHFLR